MEPRVAPRADEAYIDPMSVGEYTGYGVSGVALVAGGMFAKSAVLNWIVGPVLAVIFVVVASAIEERIRRGSNES